MKDYLLQMAVMMLCAGSAVWVFDRSWAQKAKPNPCTPAMITLQQAAQRNDRRLEDADWSDVLAYHTACSEQPSGLVTNGIAIPDNHAVRIVMKPLGRFETVAVNDCLAPFGVMPIETVRIDPRGQVCK